MGLLYLATHVILCALDFPLVVRCTMHCQHVDKGTNVPVLHWWIKLIVLPQPEYSHNGYTLFPLYRLLISAGSAILNFGQHSVYYITYTAGTYLHGHGNLVCAHRLALGSHHLSSYVAALLVHRSV